jgi:hypothetical protein
MDILADILFTLKVYGCPPWERRPESSLVDGRSLPTMVRAMMFRFGETMNRTRTFLLGIFLLGVVVGLLLIVPIAYTQQQPERIVIGVPVR